MTETKGQSSRKLRGKGAKTARCRRKDDGNALERTSSPPIILWTTGSVHWGGKPSKSGGFHAVEFKSLKLSGSVLACANHFPNGVGTRDKQSHNTKCLLTRVTESVQIFWDAVKTYHVGFSTPAHGRVSDHPNRTCEAQGQPQNTRNGAMDIQWAAAIHQETRP